MKNRMSPLTSPVAEALTWLEAKVYGPKRQRTVQLVKLTVDALRKQGQRVSLASVTATSKQVDPQGRGVSQSALLNNAEACSYYKQHRNWNRVAPRPLPKDQKLCEYPLPVKAGRNVTRARSRYFKMNKRDLVDRLLAVEQAHARQYELWLQINDELLRQQLDH